MMVRVHLILLCFAFPFPLLAADCPVNTEQTVTGTFVFDMTEFTGGGWGYLFDEEKDLAPCRIAHMTASIPRPSECKKGARFTVSGFVRRVEDFEEMTPEMEIRTIRCSLR